MDLAVFVVFALLALASALVVVTNRNPVYATMALVVTLFSTAVLFVMLGAPFLAALQILLYTGAILVLFLFVLMLLNVGKERPDGGRTRGQFWGALGVGALFLGGLASALWAAAGPTRPAAAAPISPPSLKQISAVLFSTYMLPFQIIGVLLLVAVIAATIIARRPSPGPAAQPEEE
ncbi:MAG: NADH-quinone oxidoreductase subunit J [Holophagales bacterium]|nr:MAG: NADH-quinone oxidoreductase subunit J [Holophagales bacterium]